MPASAEAFFKSVMELAEFDIVPTEPIIDWVTGRNSDNIFRELGPFFLVLLLGAVLLATLILFYCCRDANDYIGAIYDNISHKIFWNGSIRYLIEGYMELLLGALLAVDDGLDWSTDFTRITSLFTVSTISVLVVGPFILSSYLKSKHRLFRDGEFLDRFKEVIGNLSWRSKLSPYFISIFCYRRLAQILLIMYCAKYPWL